MRIGSACALLLLASTRVLAQPAGAEFRVNAATTGSQERPRVAGSPVQYVVTWDAPDGNFLGVFARRLLPDGTPQGVEFRVNVVTGGDQQGCSVAVEASGDFVVVWSSIASGGDEGEGILARRYAANGGAETSEFLVNTHTTGDQVNPDVACAGNGDCVVVWNGPGAGDGSGVFGQRYLSTGAPAGGQFRVNTYTTGSQYEPSVAVDATEGHFVVTWGGTGDGDDDGVFAQRFTSGGAFLGSEFRVNTTTSFVQSTPRVFFEPSDEFSTTARFAVVFTNNSSGDQMLQRYAAVHGGFGPSGVETSVGKGSVGSVTIDEAGDILVAFSTGLGNPEARFVDVSGTLIGTPFRVNTYTTGVQVRPAVATSASGRYLVVWQSEAQDGQGNGVYGQRYNRNGDANGDGVVTVADVFHLINFLFAGGPAPLSLSNVNGIGGTDVSDVFYLINFLFAAGPAPV